MNLVTQASRTALRHFGTPCTSGAAFVLAQVRPLVLAQVHLPRTTDISGFPHLSDALEDHL